MHASVRALLTGERTALNLLQRMSGIATTTRRYADLVAGTGVQLLDTRKTAPGLRALDKHAVACGGGTNHRAGLHDAVLIKDNHVAVAGGVPAAIERVRLRHPGRPVEVEVDTMAELQQALDAGADVILLDNMPPGQLRRAVADDGRTRTPGGVRRHHHRHHPRGGRDRGRRDLGGSAHALGAGARHRTGGTTISILTEPDIETMQDEVRALARERNAVILAHNYQVPEVQDVADYVGDSLGLSQQAAATDADVIVFAGVHFMAETAAILAPERTVLIPDLEAGCSLAASIDAEALERWKQENPGAVVVSYVNTTAEVKALSDYCCTSGNARAIIEAVPEDRDILFLPDMFLGAYLERLTGRRMKIWPGECHVHAGIRPQDVSRMMEERPDADLLIHPECGCASQCLYAAAHDAKLAETTHVLSTEGMVRHVTSSPRTRLRGRNRDRHPAPAAQGGARQAVLRDVGAGGVPLHEADHPAQAAGQPARDAVPGDRPRRRRCAGAPRDRADGGDRVSPAPVTLVLVPTELEARRLALRHAPLELCGFGLARAGVGAMHAIARHRPQRVVLAGVAGSYDAELAPIGAVLAPAAGAMPRPRRRRSDAGPAGVRRQRRGGARG